MMTRAGYAPSRPLWDPPTRPAARIQAVLLAVLLAAFGGVAAAFNIQMVVWRGVTSAEQAFNRHVVERGLTDEVKIWDAAQDAARLPDIRRQILARPPDLLYLFGTTVTLAFANVKGDSGNDAELKALGGIPMIFNIVADPVGSGITRDYGPTGRNLTGVSHSVPLSVQAKVISDLGVTRVAALFNPAESNSSVTLETLNGHLLSHHIVLTRVPVTVALNRGRSPKRWLKIAERLRKTGVGLVYLPSDSLVISRAEAIVARLHQAGLPTFSATEEPISKGGALMGVISHYSAAGLHAAVIAERILRQGVYAGDIPIATPSRYLFLVNENSMRRLRYYPPIPLLRFAEFIEAVADPIE